MLPAFKALILGLDFYAVAGTLNICEIYVIKKGTLDSYSILSELTLFVDLGCLELVKLCTESCYILDKN